MTLFITEECPNCGACEPECPNHLDGASPVAFWKPRLWNSRQASITGG